MKIALDDEDIERIAEAVARKLVSKQPEAELESEDLITREEYAQMMQVSMQTVSNWFSAGHLRGKKIGNRLYICKQQEIKAIHEHTD